MKNVKISDAADFNSFLKFVLVSDNEKNPKQAQNTVLTFPFIKFLGPLCPKMTRAF